jgi:hypothetical protein
MPFVLLPGMPWVYVPSVAKFVGGKVQFWGWYKGKDAKEILGRF